jgi:hypothetical protein
MRLFGAALFAMLSWSGSLAVALEKFVVAERLDLRLGAVALSIPSLALEETPLAKEALAALFSGGPTPPFAERLAHFAAKRARIREAKFGSLPAEQGKDFFFNDIELENVVSGRVGGLRVAKVEESERDGPPSGVARGENLTASGVDLIGIARLLEGARAGVELAPVADAAALETLSVASKDGDFSASVQRLSTRRPRLGRLPEEASRGLSGEWSAPPDAALLVKELLAAVAFETLEAHDLLVSGRGSTAHGASSIGARDLAFEGLEAGVARRARLAGFNLKSADGGGIALDSLSFEGLDIGAALTRRMLKALHFDKARLERLMGDAPAPDGQGRTKFALDEASLDLANFRDGAPTKAAACFRGLRLDLAARGEEPNAKFLRDLGYSTLELSGAAEAEWREATRTLEVSKLALDAKSLFSLTLDAKLSNVDGVVFTANPIVAAVVLATARVEKVEATLAEAAFLDRLIEPSARESGANPAELGATYARDMGEVILAALGGGEKAQRVAKAVERWILRRSRLRIALTAPKGLGVTELMRSPPEILQELEVEASAE